MTVRLIRLTQIKFSIYKRVALDFLADEKHPEPGSDSFGSNTSSSCFAALILVHVTANHKGASVSRQSKSK